MKKLALFLIFLLSGCSLIERAPFRAPSSEEKSCFQRVGIFHSKLSRDELEGRVLAFRENLGVRNLLIDQNARVFDRASQVAVPNSQGEYDLIEIYGRPIKQDGKLYINFKESPEDLILSRYPVELLKEKYIENFSYEFNRGDYILMPSVSKNVTLDSYYTPWKIMDIEGDEIKIRHRKGKKRVVSWGDIFDHNFFLTNDEQNLVQSFFSNGGKGEFFYYEPRVENELSYRGLYIYVEDLPDFDRMGEDFDFVFNDRRSYTKTKELLDKDLSLFWTTNQKGFYGFHANANSHYNQALIVERTRYAKKATITLTPNADTATIVHEERHFEDNVTKAINETMSKTSAILHEKNLFDEEFYLILHKFLLEQRAYSTEFRFVDEETFDDKQMKLFKGPGFEMELGESSYYGIKRQHSSDLFRSLYFAGLNQKLKEFEPDVAKALVLEFSKACIDHELTRCSDLFRKYLE